MARAREVLSERFGHDDFTGLQRQIIEHVLGGGSALVILPTGGGKSLCYQLPALLLDGVTVVLSPLIALMQDQVDALRKKGIEATFINSSLDRRERERRLQEVVKGRVRLLYVTPERFRQAPFREAMSRVRVPLLAVDEAHCISAWGHDFRPEYARLRRIRSHLGDPPTIALTATATLDTQRDIREKLGIEDARLFFSGIERENLFVSVREVSGREEKIRRILDLIRQIDGPGIVYTALIKELEALRERLYRLGVNALIYHGELSAGDRRRALREFLESRDGVILATNAFGMGVDKSDIRFIVHAQVPGSVEAYYQEIGRAGRDGETSLCELLYDPEDLMIQKRFVEWTNPDPEFVRNVYHTLERWRDHLYAHDMEELNEQLLVKNRSDGRADMVLALFRAEGIVAGSFENKNLELLRKLEPGEEARLVHPEKRRRDLERLLQVMELARADSCRKALIHGYFGVEWEGEGCGSCDVCADVEERLRTMPGPRASGTVGDDSAGEEGGAPVRPGQWIRVKGRFVVSVQNVRRQKGDWLVRAQSADDFKLRTYNLSRVPWEPVE